MRRAMFIAVPLMLAAGACSGHKDDSDVNAVAPAGFVPPTALNRTDFVDLLDRHFNQYDVNHDSILQAKEIPERHRDRIMSFDANESGSLSWTELKAMIAANKADTKGNLASKAEFGLLIAIGADTTEPESGEAVKAVSRKRLESIYTGTLFYDIAADRAHRKQSPFDAKLPE